VTNYHLLHIKLYIDKDIHVFLMRKIIVIHSEIFKYKIQANFLSQKMTVSAI